MNRANHRLQEHSLRKVSEIQKDIN